MGVFVEKKKRIVKKKTKKKMETIKFFLKIKINQPFWNYKKWKKSGKKLFKEKKKNPEKPILQREAPLIKI